jgi:hypothetical protein
LRAVALRPEREREPRARPCVLPRRPDVDRVRPLRPAPELRVRRVRELRVRRVERERAAPPRRLLSSLELEA